MNKLKDIIYDKNDLLIALIILLCAAFIIYQRIDVIMGYPSTLEATAQTNTTESAVQYSGNNESSKDTSEDSSKTDSQNTDKDSADTSDTNTPASSSDTGKTNGEAVTVSIKYGDTGSDIAALLVDSGLLDSKQEFYDAVSKAGADTRLKAGNFNVPMGSTPDEIIAIITK